MKTIQNILNWGTGARLQNIKVALESIQNIVPANIEKVLGGNAN